MAEEKKFLDAEGLKHFWEMCRLQSDEDFQTNLEIFEVMAERVSNIETKTGINRLPDNIKDIFEVVEKQSILAFETNHATGLITYITMDGIKHTFPIAKLYGTTGDNEDGTMTQKAITEELNKKVGVQVDNSTNTLIFTR